MHNKYFAELEGQFVRLKCYVCWPEHCTSRQYKYGVLSLYCGSHGLLLENSEATGLPVLMQQLPQKLVFVVLLHSGETQQGDHRDPGACTCVAASR